MFRELVAAAVLCMQEQQSPKKKKKKTEISIERSTVTTRRKKRKKLAQTDLIERRQQGRGMARHIDTADPHAAPLILVLAVLFAATSGARCCCCCCRRARCVVLLLCTCALERTVVCPRSRARRWSVWRLWGCREGFGAGWCAVHATLASCDVIMQRHHATSSHQSIRHQHHELLKYHPFTFMQNPSCRLLTPECKHLSPPSPPPHLPHHHHHHPPPPHHPSSST